MINPGLLSGSIQMYLRGTYNERNMKLDLNKILIATDFIQESAEELGYEYLDTLGQLLDEVDSLAMNTLEEEE